MSESKNGFSLLEVMAAIVLTGLFMSVFVQLFAIARNGNQIPGELFAAVARARSALAQPRRPDRAEIANSSSSFHERMEISNLQITENPGTLAPPLPSKTVAKRPVSRARKPLHAVSVVITTPSGRRIELDGVTSLPPK